MAFFATTALALVFLAASGRATVEDGPDATSAPVVDGKPLEVAIGFYVLDFARITSRDESFDVTGYLELTWRDPRLAGEGTSSKRGATRRLDAKQIWTPRVFFENAVEQPKFHNDPVVEVDDQGMVTSWAIITGKYSVPMDLKRFPFDRQVLPVRIGAFEDQSVMTFVVKRDMVQVAADAFVTDWTIEKNQVSARVDSRVYVRGDNAYSRYVYTVPVVRRATFYLWRVLLPLTLLTVVSWSIFWFEPVGLQPQISTCLASLIALVAFNFAIDFSLPKVAYLTLIDKHALIGFGFVAAAVVEVALVHVAVTRGRTASALSIQRAARWGFPLAYVLAIAINVSVLFT
jgi:hypothetical protein